MSDGYAPEYCVVCEREIPGRIEVEQGKRLARVSYALLRFDEGSSYYEGCSASTEVCSLRCLRKVVAFLDKPKLFGEHTVKTLEALNRKYFPAFLIAARDFKTLVIPPGGPEEVVTALDYWWNFRASIVTEPEIYQTVNACLTVLIQAEQEANVG